MGVLSGNPKDEPMHYGEVFSVWSCSMAAKTMISCYQTYQNHAGDKDLLQMVGEMIEQAKKEEKECDALLNANGILPAPSMPEKPKAKLEDIPIGARFTDPEIAASISMDNAIGLTACSQAMGSSIREDIGALFAKTHAAKTTLGGKLLRMNKDKGWLVPPPLQIKTPELVHN